LSILISLLTDWALQRFAIPVAAPLLPGFMAVPLKVAAPSLTLALNPCALSFGAAASLSVIHF
jgi:hypothetical protein